jgi:hypothetical protein
MAITQSEAVRIITQAAYLCDVSLNDINNNFVWADDNTEIFPDNQKANAYKHRLITSNNRYVNAKKINEDGSRSGSKGNRIDFSPLPESFDWYDYITRKPGRKLTLPKFTTEIYESQFTLGKIDNNKAGKEKEADVEKNVEEEGK